MRLVSKTTGLEIPLGSEVDPGRRGIYRLSGQDPDKGIIFLFQEPGDGSPFPVKPDAIGAKFAA